MNITRRSLLSRRQILMGLGPGAIAMGAYPAIVEPQWLETTHTRIPVGANDPIRILHLTDLHASWVVPDALIERAIDLGLQNKPDLICLTGDYITTRFDFDAGRYRRILSRLAAAKPTYAVLGNHDAASPRVVTKLLEEAGIALLHNRAEHLDLDGRKLTLAGVGDLWTGELDAYRAFASAKRAGPVVALAHNPDSKDEIVRYDWDLMLSGHTHGGQVRIPLDGPRFAPVRDKRFVQGLGRWDGRHIYVSRGVGNIAGVRLACRPEVSILDLVA